MKVLDLEPGKLYKFIGVYPLNVYRTGNPDDGVMTEWELTQNDWFMFVRLESQVELDLLTVDSASEGMMARKVKTTRVRLIKIMNHELLGFVLVHEDENAFLPHNEETYACEP